MWNLIKKQIRCHGTKWLGVSQGTIAAIAASGVIPDRHLKYYLLASGLLTTWRGFINSNPDSQ